MVSKKNWPKRQTNILNLSKLGQLGPLHCELPGNVHNIYLSIYLHTGIPGTRYLFV
jgi:O-antigen ligase